MDRSDQLLRVRWEAAVNLDHTAAVIRPRPPWEAVDLGFAMARTWWRSIAVAWLTTVVPLWVVVLVVLGRHPGWCLLVLWWLKPLYDVPVLSVVSRILFGAAPGWRETVATTWSTWWRQGHRLLLWRRLDPSRSFFLPVFLLEGLKGRPLRERNRLLGRGAVFRDSSTLTLAMSLLETCALFAVIGAVAMLQPSSTRSIWTLVGEALSGEGPLWFLLCAMGIWLLTVTLLEPCYVAAGFCLYLNRRTLLEGWDVELGLRRLGARLRRRRRKPIPSAAAMVTLLFLLVPVGIGFPAGAQGPDIHEESVSEESVSEESPAKRAAKQLEEKVRENVGESDGVGESTTVATDRDPAAVAAEVLSHEDFGSLQEIETWRLKHLRDQPDRDPTIASLPWLAPLMEILLWILVAVAVLWLVVKLLPRFDRPRRRAIENAPEPVGVPSSLAPRTRVELLEDVPAAALAELAAGRSMVALSLLYRGTLAALAQRRRLEIHQSWTEDQCLDRVALHLPEGPANYLREVTLTWQAAAYGHALPIDDAVRDLCHRWAPELAA
ncbi:MAG: DUF4129 domain-containing protein [Thermoanaerobaculia bacterium]|nr:DUF4129 domain-containing protein [Thermoanaerobaculia bacterium]